MVFIDRVRQGILSQLLCIPSHGMLVGDVVGTTIGCTESMQL